MRVLADFALRSGSTESHLPCIALYGNEPQLHMVLLNPGEVGDWSTKEKNAKGREKPSQNAQ